MRRIPPLALLATAALALTGCADQPAAAPQTQDTTRPAYATWAKTAQEPIAAWVDTWDANSCDNTPELAKCAGTMTAGQNALKTAVDSMNSNTKPDGARYLGDPSEQVKADVQAIRDAMTEAAGAGSAWAETGCAGDASITACDLRVKVFAATLRDTSQALGALAR